MRIVPSVLITLLAAFQALLTIVWMKLGVAQKFTDMFVAFNGAVPAWTALAYAVGWYWLALPVAGIAWLFVAWRWPAQRRNAWTVTAASLAATLSMVYAMYPLHILPSMSPV